MRGLGSAVVVWLSTVAALPAAVIFVDNENGDDTLNGSSLELATALSGPVKTLRRATLLAQRGDQIYLRNNATPYFESLVLTGARRSGFENTPFTILGNGATLCGLRRLPSDAWQSVGDGLWRVSLTRKGHYRFFQNGKPQVESQATGPFDPEALAVNEWQTARGNVFFRFEPKTTPTESQWTYAAEEFGISLVAVDHVRIEDLRVIGFRQDGIHVDNDCRDVALVGVTVEHNGRAGVGVSGSAQVRLIGSKIADNGRYTVQVTEAASITLEECTLTGGDPVIEK